MNFFGQSSALAPAGPHAQLAANVWWILFGLCATVYVSVVVVLLASVFLKKGEPSHRRQRLAVGLAGGATIVILLAILGASVRAGHGMHPPPSEARLTVKVIAHQWWWEIIYPGSPANQTVFTANELHIPVRTKVLVELTSRDVIHSFWVPALHGKRDLIPGHDSTTFLEADQPGIYHGQCAEFCGVAHANMAFLVHAEPPDVFQRWLDQQRKPAAAPVSQSALQGQQLFMRTTCPGCHTITGTDAGGAMGPDLTHFASRASLGSGIRTNQSQHLREWIFDPAASKPGVHMPGHAFSGDELAALDSFLEGLQ